MNEIKFANDLLRAKKYPEALSHYENLKNKYPSLTLTIDANISICKRNIIPITQAVDQKITIEQLYEQVSDGINTGKWAELTDGPMVTIVMTSHNVEEYIEQSVMSVLGQTYKNKELIIVDDCSTDKTLEILERIRLSVSGVKVLKLNTNLGTYYGKNYAISTAKGEYIFFQDSDDIAHPSRIALCMRQFVDNELLCVRTCYSRVSFPSGQVVTVNGLVKKLGLITVGYHKSVFQELGYFNNTSKASDDEMFNRVRASYKRNKFKDIDLPLYYGTLREGSLFTDMFDINNIVNNIVNNNIEQKPAASRLLYHEAFTELHKNTDRDGLRNIFKFPVLRDVIAVEPDMTRLSNPKIPVVFNICTYPPRRNSLKKTLDSIINQADVVNVFLDKYTEVPEFIKDYGNKINIFMGSEYGDLRDNGKFLALSKPLEECYYFTIDDDIVYPPDYSHALIRKVEEYDRKCAVGVHGVLVRDKPTGYFSSFRTVFSFWKKLETDHLVNNLGTGTVAVHSSLLSNLDVAFFKSPGMLDVYFSVYCKNNDIPMIAVSRPESWLQEIKASSKEAAPTLFDEFKTNDSVQAELILSNVPWGYKGISETLSQAAAGDNSPLKKLWNLMPVLRSALLT